jgi:argininosuccinate lyase
MTNLWSGRFDTAPDAAAFEFGASFRFDRRLFEDDVTGSIAWARALAKAGLLPGDEARQIADTLAAIFEQGRSDPAFVNGPDEDLRRRIPLLQRASAALVQALAAQAASAGDALMPSFTHFRPAQPVLVAHFFLSHAAPLRRDFARLHGAREECDALTLGSGAIAGTAYPIDVEALARDLGFSRIVDNSMDASSDRDFAATFLYACAMTMVHLSRLAEDLIIFCGDEHHFFELSDALSTGSSMMPQKKNPDPLELVRGKAGRAIGHLVGLLTTIKGLPTGYNKDLQEDKEAVFSAEDTLGGCLAIVRSVVGGLTLDRARAASAASGLLLATDVADYLVGRGVPFRRAHEIVGALVRKLVAEKRDFGSLSTADWRAASELFGADVVARVTPGVSVAAKRTPQSTSPAAVDARLKEVRKWLDGLGGLC